MTQDAGLQDGMLEYYLSQARFADANVTARMEREPFDYRRFQAAVVRNRKAAVVRNRNEIATYLRIRRKT